MNSKICAFVKPWPQLDCYSLAQKLAEYGFDAVELCIRKGYQVYSSEHLEKNLKEAINIFSSFGIEVVGAGADLSEENIIVCGNVGIPYIRTLMTLDDLEEIDLSVKNAKKKIENLVVCAENNNVIIGIQEHNSSYVKNSIMLYEIIKYFDSAYVRGIWDSAHSIFSGENETFGLSFLIPYLCSLQIKNITIEGKTKKFVSGESGIIDWKEIVSYLDKAHYKGHLVLTHEYTDSSKVDELFKLDCHFIRQLMENI